MILVWREGRLCEDVCVCVCAHGVVHGCLLLPLSLSGAVQ